VLVTLQRAEMTSRMAERITRDCVELGSEGRLIRLQLEELVGNVVPTERDAIVRDYHAIGAGAEATIALEALRALGYQDLLDFERLASSSAIRAESIHSTIPSSRGAIASSRISRASPSR